MGVKGINPLEAHCEKAVLGLAGVALVGVLVWQFAGPKPTVRVGAKEPELTEAHDVLEQRATVVKGQIEGPGSPDALPAKDMPLGLLAQAGDFSSTSIVPAQKLAIGLGTPGIPVDGVAGVLPVGAQGTQFAEVDPPAPSKPAVAQVAATVHPRELVLNDGLIEYVAEPDRPDMVAVSVEASWSASDFIEALRRDPDGPEGPVQPMPGVWWNNVDMTIFDVELMRQKKMVDGSWGEEESVARMPGRVELRTEMAEAGQEMMTADQLRQWANQATQFAEEIRRPRFYSIVFGDDWVPPSEVDPMAGIQAADPAIEQNLRQLAGVRRRIVNIEERLAELGGGGREGGGRRPPGGGHDGPPPTDDREDADQNDRRRRTLERELESLRKQETQIIDRLRELGATNIPGVEQLEPMPGQQATPSEAEADPPLLEADEIRIWAHDINVERGATYRYRLRVWVTNPFFGHDAGLIDEQKPLAASPVLAGESSEWSDEVNVHDEAYYFITSAQEGGLAAGARAVAAVYVFRWGYWREGTARMEPGDALATEVECPDLGEVLAQVELPEAPEQWQPGGRGPGGHGHPAPAPGGAAQPEEELPVAPEIPRERIPVTRDVVLLDIGPSLNAMGEKIAYLREETGAIVDRDPEAEQQKQTYQLVYASYQRGQQALKPKEPLPDPMQPDRPRPGQLPPGVIEPEGPRPGGPGGG